VPYLHLREESQALNFGVDDLVKGLVDRAVTLFA